MASVNLLTMFRRGTSGAPLRAGVCVMHFVSTKLMAHASEFVSNLFSKE